LGLLGSGVVCSVCRVVAKGNGSKLERRVIRAAEAALAERKFVTAIDVLVGVGWLEPRRVDEWRQGVSPIWRRS
jgi:hypothetical protein